jgi:molybdate transport system permease protein
MTAEEWRIALFTLQMAATSTLLILPPGLLLGWLLARRNWPGKSLVETLVTLPIVMPPVATGLLLLQTFGRRRALGSFLDRIGIDIVFTWKAVVLAMMVMSIPLLLRAARTAFEEVNPRLEQIAETLGASPTRVFFTITLPLARRGVAGGVVLAFARAVGEFGATILVAGDIPGRTRTIALTIYERVQLGHDSSAYRMVALSAIIAFGALWTSETLLRPRRRA